MSSWIRESNLIEGVDDPAEDTRGERAWRWLLRQGWLEQRVLLTLHRRLLRVLNPRIAGKYRCRQVWVGGREGAPWEAIPKLIDDWLEQYDRPKTDTEIQAAHVAFERIHPFEDGNGRVGRMVMNFQRVRAGLAPLTILAAERQAYYGWFDSCS